MKMSRLFSVVLFAFIIGTAASAQDSTEIIALRAKAERGNGIAQYNLGLAYLEGRGTVADPIQAYVWLSLARENGTRGRALDTLVGSLDKATLEAAQQKFTAYKAANNIRTAAPATAARVESAPAKPAGPGAPMSLVEAPKAPPGGAERDSLAARVAELTADLAVLRADRLRLAQLAAQNEKFTEAATEANHNLQEKVQAAETRQAELSREAETAKAELARTKQSLAALEQAPKPAADTTALTAKTRELQAALTELEASRTFGRQVEDTLNKVNDDKARVAAAAAAELEAARKFGQQVEATLNRVNDEKTALAAQLASATAATTRAQQEAAALAQANQALAAKPVGPAQPDLSVRVAELEGQLAKAKQPAAPAYPD
ncbi:MAG: hypothetical protein PSW75_07545, partial [bacterium]|nr:hypothetical protein [bacterium]